MPRFLLPPAAWDAPAPALDGDEAKHLAQVLRARAGDTITVFDGNGRRAAATILDVARDRVALRLGEVDSPAAPAPRITLAQSIPKGKTMDLVVRKSVELGVAAIVPLVTRHTVVHPGEGKADKWRRAALEACKQCGQDTLPEITETASFASWLASLTAPAPGELRLIASLAPGAKPLRDILRDHPETPAATLLVGPEGDFSPEETSAALAAGFLPATLGTIVLRVETATMFCLSALRYEFDRST
jgi:16S rRNA (uracil1498-N3)-methyltransferase